MVGKQEQDSREERRRWGKTERNHHVDVVIYQKALLGPHKPKCQLLNPALIRPALSGEDRKLRGLTISVVYNNTATSCGGECDRVRRSHMGLHYREVDAALFGQIDPTTVQNAGITKKTFRKPLPCEAFERNCFVSSCS